MHSETRQPAWRAGSSHRLLENYQLATWCWIVYQKPDREEGGFTVVSQEQHPPLRSGLCQFTMKPPRKRALRKKLILVLFGLAFGLLMSEIFLRVIGYSYPIFYATDYYRGFALAPGVEGQYQREGTSYVRINSDGLRDREHPKAKPVGTFRVAVLGDSFTEAMHVPMEQTFWFLLQQKLQQCNAFPGKQVEVINFGVSGYGTAQELLTLRQKVWAYSPDLVILAFTTYNDVYDNSRTLSKTEEVPYFNYRNGELVEDVSFRESKTYRQRDSQINRLGRWFHNRLRTVQLIHYLQFVGKLRLTDLAQQTEAG